MEPHFSSSSCPSPPAEPHTPSGLRAPPKSCQHNGTLYQHGEMFSAHELFPSRLPNQCVLCSCTVRSSCLHLAQARGLGLKSMVVWAGREGGGSPWSKQSDSEWAQEHLPSSGLLQPPELPVTAGSPGTDIGSFLFSPVDSVLLEGRGHTQFISLSSTAPGPGPGIQRMP